VEYFFFFLPRKKKDMLELDPQQRQKLLRNVRPGRFSSQEEQDPSRDWKALRANFKQTLLTSCRERRGKWWLGWTCPWWFRLSPKEERKWLEINLHVSPYDRGPLLGSGSFGKVYHIMRYDDPNNVPSRNQVIDKEFGTEQDYKTSVRKETYANKVDPSREYLRSPLLLTIPEKKTIRMRNQGISLETVFTTEELHKIIRSFHHVAAAMVLLETHRFIHGDVKKENIMMNKDGKMGIVDYDYLEPYSSAKTIFPDYIYFVWPLEVYYHPRTDRMGMYHSSSSSKKRKFVRWNDKEDRQELTDYYFPISLLKGYPEAITFMTETLLHPETARPPSPRLLRSLPKFLRSYLTVYSDPVQRKSLRYEPAKIDSYGLGLVLYQLFYWNRHELFPKNRRPLAQLEFILNGMLHPLPSKRWDAFRFYQEWGKFRKLMGGTVPSLNTIVSPKIPKLISTPLSP